MSKVTMLGVSLCLALTMPAAAAVAAAAMQADQADLATRVEWLRPLVQPSTGSIGHPQPSALTSVANASRAASFACSAARSALL